MKKRTHKKTEFGWVLYIVAAYLVIAAVVMAERFGVRYKPPQITTSYLEPGTITLAATPESARTTLLVVDANQAESANQAIEWRYMLAAMDVPFEEIDLADGAPPADFSGYEKLVITLPNLLPLQASVPALGDWVKAGGGALFSATLESNSSFMLLQQKLGIVEYGGNTFVEQFAVDDFMVGGNITMPMDDGFESALAVQLAGDCTVHIDDGAVHPTPLLWERPYGEGNFVVVNLGFLERSVRGIYAAAYSLLGDACVYPVVNSSLFYIDDFPSPVPAGNGEYVKAEYNRDISSFYTNVWWPDMEYFSEKYGIRYTGVIIENYEDETVPPFVRNTDVSRFSFFGTSLLDMGGELGYHGYNHQPLVLESFDYKGLEDYAKWPDTAAMEAAVRELHDFSSGIFPDSTFTVYVPPSNILSDEGRDVVAAALPDLQSIASIYFFDGVGYGQELEVADDGIVEMPRTVSGAELDAYMKRTVLSELNFHFYNAHFLHPDDLLDPARGAALGWEYLSKTYEDYISYVSENVPALRQQVASEAIGAVQRYCYANVAYQVTAQAITVDITNFFDESFCFVRVRRGTPGTVTGGTLTHLTGDIYLLDARRPQVVIELEGAA